MSVCVRDYIDPGTFLLYVTAVLCDTGVRGKGES